MLVLVTVLMIKKTMMTTDGDNDCDDVHCDNVLGDNDSGEGMTTETETNPDD